MRAEQPHTSTRESIMKNELNFAADFIANAINSQDTKTLQTALIFSLGVVFAADTDTWFQHKAQELVSLDIILHANFAQLVTPGHEILGTLRARAAVL
jgi:hypothetical protein